MGLIIESFLILAFFLTFCSAYYRIISPADGTSFPAGASSLIPVEVSQNSSFILLTCINIEKNLYLFDSKPNITANHTVYFRLNNHYIGSCTISASRQSVAGSASATINIVNGVYFVEPSPTDTSLVDAGTSIDVLYQVILTQSDTSLMLAIVMTCSEAGLEPYFQLVPINQSTPFYIPINYYGTCSLSVLDETGAFMAANSPVLIVNESPIFISPQPNSNSFYPNSIIVRVNLRSSTAQDLPFNGSLTCDGGPAFDFTGFYNTDNLISPSIDYVGSCRITIVSSSQPNVANAQVDFSRYYDVQFVKAPATLISNFPFNIVLRSTMDPSFGFTLILTCPQGLGQSWPNIQASIINTLQAPVNTFGKVLCLFSILNGLDLVSVSFITDESPFGTQMYPITEEEQIQFAKSITFPPRLYVDL